MNAIHIILAALVGFALGFIAARFALRGGKGEQEKLQTELDAVQQAFDAYRSRVDRHFADTADAVDELNRSYQNVIRHLSGGAQNLMGEAALREQLERRGGKTVTLGYLAEEGGQNTATAEPQPPRQEERPSENPEAAAKTEPQTQPAQTPTAETAQAEAQERPSENNGDTPPAESESGTENSGKTPV